MTASTLFSQTTPPGSLLTDEECRAKAIEVITRAFHDDPVVRWVFPDARVYAVHFPKFIPAFAGAAFTSRTVELAEDLSGAALWLQPGEGPDEESVIALLAAAVPAQRQQEVFAMLEQMGACHPAEPHWYLPLIGVDPLRQGQGIGSTLLRRTLARCDQERKAAYLESTQPRNVSLYLRHGFRVMGEIRVGDSPPIIPMWRQPVG